MSPTYIKCMLPVSHITDLMVSLGVLLELKPLMGFVVHYQACFCWFLLLVPSSAWFLIPCWPLSTQRLDPIISPGTTSSHVHQIVGGSAFGPTVNAVDLEAASCTSCMVSHDKSNYWVPAVYFQHANGSFERVPQVGSASIYYFNEKSRAGPTEVVETIPSGLRMVVGDPSRRTAASDQTYNALNHKCLDYSGVSTDWKTFPPHNCPDGVRVEATFPSCWDGHRVDTDDHKSHVTYPTDTIESGPCPNTHPHHLVTVKVEFIFDTGAYAAEWHNSTQPFRYANGDSTGYGLHADFLMGWESETLRSAVDECLDPAGLMTNCPAFQGLIPLKQQYTNPGTCKIQDFVLENVGGILSELPGCNMVT